VGGGFNVDLEFVVWEFDSKRLRFRKKLIILLFHVDNWLGWSDKLTAGIGTDRLEGTVNLL